MTNYHSTDRKTVFGAAKARVDTAAQALIDAATAAIDAKVLHAAQLTGAERNAALADARHFAGLRDVAMTWLNGDPGGAGD